MRTPPTTGPRRRPRPARRPLGRRPERRRAHRIRRPGPVRRTARPSHTASRCPRPGCRGGPAPSRARPAGHGHRPGNSPSGSHHGRRSDSPPVGSPRANHRAPSSRTGRCSSSASRKGRGCPQRIGIGQPGNGSGVDRVDGGQGGGRLSVRPVRAARQLVVAQDPSGDGLALEPFDHQPAGIEAVRRRPAATTSGTGTPAVVGRPQQARFHLHPRRPGQLDPSHLLEDQAADLPGAQLEIECAGDPGRPARQPPHPGHPTAERGPELHGQVDRVRAHRPTPVIRRLIDRDGRSPIGHPPGGGTRRCRTRTGPRPSSVR